MTIGKKGESRGGGGGRLGGFVEELCVVPVRSSVREDSSLQEECGGNISS